MMDYCMQLVAAVWGTRPGVNQGRKPNRAATAFGPAPSTRAVGESGGPSYDGGGAVEPA